MEREKLNYLSNHQNLRFEDGDDVLKLAAIERKCLIQTFAASCHLLSNAEKCAVLKTDLQKNTHRMKDANEFIDNKISQALQNSKGFCGNWETGLNKINFNSLTSPLPCTNIVNTRCKLPGIKRELEEATKSSKRLPQASKMVVLPAEPEPKVRKIAKSFAPQCCAPKKQENRPANVFKTARDELAAQNVKKLGNQGAKYKGYQVVSSGSGGVKRKLGIRRGVHGKFVSPMLSSNKSGEELPTKMEMDENVDERLKNVDPRMVEMIRSEIMDIGGVVEWDDIAGLNFAKTIIKESVVLPLLRPDIFTGLRRPPRGILLFGPPGTGKTLIGKCVASQSKSTFFSISASSLTSKWIGEGEKMVRVLFTVARCHQPAVVFIDEIDSLLTQRSETEHESTRRIKTEFFVQLDGATTDSEDRILLIGATNRPQELDEAARRRFERRLYIPLPEYEARLQLATKLMSQEQHTLANADLEQIARLSQGFSGADMRQLCSEASMGPIRSIDLAQIEKIEIGEVRPINIEDFKKAFTRVKASVATKDLDQYVVWNQTYGSGS